jgi:hypothetical protein
MSTTFADIETTSRTQSRPFLLTAAVVAGPLAGAVWHVIDKVGLPRIDPADYLSQVAANRTPYAISTLLYLIFVACSIPTGMMAMRVLRDRAPLLGTLSGLLLGLAGVLGLVVTGMRPLALALAPAEGVTADAVAAYTRYQDSIWFGGIMLPMLLSAVGGLILLTAAILRTGVVTRWAAPALIGGFVLSSGEFPPVITIVGSFVQLAGFLPLAAALFKSGR